MVYRISQNNVPDIYLNKLSKNKHLSIIKDDTISECDILLIYSNDSSEIKDRMSIYQFKRPIVIIIIPQETPLRVISDIYSCGVSVVLEDNINLRDTLDKVIGAAISSTIYNAGTHSGENALYTISENIKFNSHMHALFINGVVHKLNPRESAILQMLCDNSGEYLNKKYFLYSIWGNKEHGSSRSFDVYINRLRHLIEGDDTVYIRKIRGTGYAIVCGEQNKMIKNKY